MEVIGGDKGGIIFLILPGKQNGMADEPSRDWVEMN